MQGPMKEKSAAEQGSETTRTKFSKFFNSPRAMSHEAEIRILRHVSTVLPSLGGSLSASLGERLSHFTFEQNVSPCLFSPCLP
jgi:hypothetical protein